MTSPSRAILDHGRSRAARSLDKNSPQSHSPHNGECDRPIGVLWLKEARENTRSGIYAVTALNGEVRPGDLVGRDPASTGAGPSAPVVTAPHTAAGPLISRVSHHAFAPPRLSGAALGMLVQLNLLFGHGRMVTPTALGPAY